MAAEPPVTTVWSEDASSWGAARAQAGRGEGRAGSAQLAATRRAHAHLLSPRPSVQCHTCRRALTRRHTHADMHMCVHIP